MASGELALALAAAREADWPGALRALLAAWRANRAPDIARALEAVSARAAAAVTTPIAHSDGERNAMWFERAKHADVVTLAELCATVDETRRAAELLRRVELLLPHGPDPRIAMMVCDLLERPTHSAIHHDLQPFWRRLWTWLPELGDPRIVARVVAFPDQWGAGRNILLLQRDEHFAAIVAAYPEVPALEADDLATCELVIACAETPTQQELDDRARDAELRAAIYAAPGDTSARQVYADWLQERGDPRGEYITLSLTRERHHAHDKRLRALETTFGALWRAPIKNGEMWAGFVRSSSDRDDLVDDERLATLETSCGVPANDDVRLPNLRMLDVIDSQLEKLARLTRPLEVTHLKWSPTASRLWSLRETLGRITVLPELHVLDIVTSQRLHVDDLRELAATPMLHTVRRLRLRYDPCQLHGALPILADLALDRLELVRDNRMSLALERDALRLGTLKIVLREELDVSHELLAMVAALEPEQLSSFHLSITYGLPSQRAEIEARVREALSRQTRLTSIAVYLHR